MDNSGSDGPNRTRPRREGPIAHWVFDLDNTLYSAESRLFHQIDQRMGEYIATLLDLPFIDARRLQKHYFRTFGTTLCGLMKEHQTDPAAFLDYVHDIDITVLDPDPTLDAALDQLSGPKVVFTNASRDHAEQVMARLGITRHFDGIFDIIDADYVPKPAMETYHRFISHHRIAPASAILFEDTSANLKPAAALGMTTVLVGPGEYGVRNDADADHVHHVTDDLAGWLMNHAQGATGTE
jgi:putative hydrolase of the HAD superfamily